MDENALPYWARGLGLQPHPEGGFFAETWRSPVTLDEAALPAGYKGSRNLATSILYLLLPGQHSAWHVVRSAELWLHQRGGPLVLSLGGDDPAGPAAGDDVRDLLLGTEPQAGQSPQLLVPPDHWQSARPATDEAVLVGCVVAPGFDADDFRLLDDLPDAAAGNFTGSSRPPTRYST
jgi:predicted cupin superfamily sugar epimerase